MAKPYKEGSGWAFRLRVDGQDIYRSGFETREAAQTAANSLVRAAHPHALGARELGAPRS